MFDIFNNVKNGGKLKGQDGKERWLAAPKDFWSGRRDQPGMFERPSHIAIAKPTHTTISSIHYVSDQFNNRVQMFRWEPGAEA
jgi:hypothetical protein